MIQKRNETGVELYINDDNNLLMRIASDMKLKGKLARDRFIFVVNKCPDEIFDEDDDEERNLLKNEVENARKNTDFENYKTYFINCINGKGFDELLKGIFEHFEKHIIKDEDLANIKNLSMKIENFNKLFEHSFFFGDISPKDVFLNESLVE